MPQQLKLPSVPVTSASILAGSQIPATDPMLWYSTPATNWDTQSLPSGGGHQGAYVFGGLASERLSPNVDSLWSGGPRPKEGWTGGNWPSDGSKNGKLKEVRDEITANGSMSPGTLASKLGIPSYSLQGGVIASFGSYLNLGSAVAGVSYAKSDGAGGLAMSIPFALLIVAAGVFLVIRNGRRHMPQRA